MASLLLVHYERPHFEIVLSLYSNLSQLHEIDLWSNAINVFERQVVLERLGLRLFKPTKRYDALVLITGEKLPPEAVAGVELTTLLRTLPTIRIRHRPVPDETKTETDIRLFPTSSFPYIPVSTGLEELFARPTSDRRSFLIQGNIENRRNYREVPHLAESLRDSEIKIVGIKVDIEFPPLSNLKILFNQSEYAFHAACAQSTFIVPMIDPTGYPGYFSSIFTSSILIGFAYGLPFVAHTQLFDLYPIRGFAYDAADGLVGALRAAETCGASKIQQLKAEMADIRSRVLAQNVANFSRRLRAAKVP